MLCKRIIAACCNIHMEKVDSFLTPLLAAVESDKNNVDLRAIAALISKSTMEV
jgi:hypothetical protein